MQLPLKEEVRELKMGHFGMWSRWFTDAYRRNPNPTERRISGGSLVVSPVSPGFEPKGGREMTELGKLVKLHHF